MQTSLTKHCCRGYLLYTHAKPIKRTLWLQKASSGRLFCLFVGVVAHESWGNSRGIDEQCSKGDVDYRGQQ